MVTMKNGYKETKMGGEVGSKLHKNCALLRCRELVEYDFPSGAFLNLEKIRKGANILQPMGSVEIGNGIVFPIG